MTLKLSTKALILASVLMLSGIGNTAFGGEGRAPYLKMGDFYMEGTMSVGEFGTIGKTIRVDRDDNEVIFIARDALGAGHGDQFQCRVVKGESLFEAAVGIYNGLTDGSLLHVKTNINSGASCSYIYLLNDSRFATKSLNVERSSIRVNVGSEFISGSLLARDTDSPISYIGIGGNANGTIHVFAREPNEPILTGIRGEYQACYVPTNSPLYARAVEVRNNFRKGTRVRAERNPDNGQCKNIDLEVNSYYLLR